MEIGVTVRNMGPQSQLPLLSRCVQYAEELGLESVWITDHIAIPPDDSEGSEGRYLEPLVTLGFLAGMTSTIRLGTGVLILPYRPALPTAKQIATLQELSAGRLLLGVGIGWMDAEFAALGLDRHQRGRASDEVLDFLNRAFSQDTVTSNDQEFLFRPRPEKPPIYIGGAAKNALPRALRFDAGWIPMGLDPERLAPALAQYQHLCEEQEREPRGVTVMAGLPLNDPGAATQLLEGYRQLGVERLVTAIRYDQYDDFRAIAEALVRLR